MSSKDYRSQAWDVLKGNWLPAIGVMLLSSIIASGCGIPFASLVLAGIMQVGVCTFFLNLFRNGKADFVKMFDGFSSNLMDNIFAGLLYTLYIALWSLLFFIPGLVKSYSYAMTFYILKDNPGMTANEAITASRQMMNGNKMRLFLLDFSFIGWILLSCITFGIASIWTIPYMQAARTAFYEDIKNS